MITVSLLKIVAFGIAATVVCGLILRKLRSDTIYLDEGKNSKVFRSNKHRIAAKPDMIKRGKYGYAIPHEFKSRKTRVLKQDIIQIKVATIALRSEYRVKQGLIEIGSGDKQIVEIDSTRKMMRGRVGELIRVVRDIKRGQVPVATPNKSTCRYCPYNTSCEYSHA